ncbi:endothelin-converting enzyme homolog isoform X2 [Hermetia illucens]|uniref:endothelin-converting enzyme homolog isoform X2 n=1 Tax=Hermetia illucens TaxID=343691 RepID=UPI0018CC017D|nr:endothelin-converting enzyme homolog isoform X2 [Hermetia illucens]
MEGGTPVWVIPEPGNQPRVPTANNGTSKCTIVSPFLVAVQSKFRRKYYHKVVFAILIVIILILLITIIILSFRTRKSTNKCESKECIRAASALLQSMDMSVDPCDDFYQFTCGNWPEEHPRPDSLTSYDWFSERQQRISRHVRKFLQQNITDQDPVTIRKVKTLYRACMDSEALEKLGLQPILDYLKAFDLPLVPALLNQTLANSTAPYEFDWIKSLVKIKKILGMDVLIGFDIFPDSQNRSTNKIGLGTPESGSALPFNDEDHYKKVKREKRKIIMETVENSDDEKDEGGSGEDEDSSQSASSMPVYSRYILKVSAAVVMYADSNVNFEASTDILVSAVEKIIAITKELYKYTEEAENITKTEENDYNYDDILHLDLAELQKQTDETVSPKTLPIWEKFITLMMEGAAVKFNPATDQILTSKADIRYLQLLTEFIMESDLKSIEFFIWWSVVDELAVHTTAALRQMHYEYMRSLIKTEGSISRSLYCANGINNLMGMAVSYSLVSEKFLVETRPKVDLMLSNIRRAFNNLVEGINWMDEETKLQTLDKSWSMKSLIGFPEWIMNKTTLDSFYKGIEANETTHLNNMVGILTWRMKRKLNTLKRKNEFGWATSPSHVNAFHTFQANTITVPIAILQYPFYELGLEALNYGAIGTILGHELTHGFDDSGRMFDKMGNMHQWWSNKTIEEYVNRTSCFVKQYGGYYIPDAEDYINGELTLGENIADNGGLREAYHAYKLYRQENGPEPALPGFEQFTHEQLFFISFGNLWCESATPSSMKYALEDTHCPGQYRLKGVLTNSPEFAKTFGCRKGSGMFPSNDRCRLW